MADLETVHNTLDHDGVPGVGKALSRTHVYRATDQNVSGSAALTDLSFSNEVTDDAGCWAIGTPTKLVIPAGLNGRVVRVYGQVHWSASATGSYRQIGIEIGSTIIAQANVSDNPGASNVTQQIETKPITVATNDEFTIWIRADGTGIGAIGGEHATYLGLYTVD